MRPHDVLRAAYAAERSTEKLSLRVLSNVCVMAEKGRTASQLVGWGAKKRCELIVPLTPVALSKEGAVGVELIAQCLTRDKEWSWPDGLLVRFAVLSGHTHRARASAYTSEVLQRFAAWTVAGHAAHGHIAPVAWACADDECAALVMVAGIRKYVEEQTQRFRTSHLLLFVGFASKALAFANRRCAGGGGGGVAGPTDAAVRADAEAVLEWALTRLFEVAKGFHPSSQFFVALLAAAGSENVERVGRTAESAGYGSLREICTAVSREGLTFFSLPELLPGAARALLAAESENGYSLRELPPTRYGFIATRSVVEEAMERHSTEGLAMFCLLVVTADWGRARCKLPGRAKSWLLATFWSGIASKVAVDALRFDALSSSKQAEHLHFTLSLMTIVIARAVRTKEYQGIFVQLSGYVDAQALLRAEDPLLQGLLCVYLALLRQGSRFAGDCIVLLREAVGAMGRDGCAWVRSMLWAVDGTRPAEGATRFEVRVHQSRFAPALCFALQACAGDTVAGPQATRVARCVAQRLAAPATPAPFDARDVDGTLAVAHILSLYVPEDDAARGALRAMWLEAEEGEMPTYYPRLTPKEVSVRASRRRTLLKLLRIEDDDNDAFIASAQRQPSWRGAGPSEIEAATAEAWSIVFAGDSDPCSVRSDVAALVSSPVRRFVLPPTERAGSV